jgi:hypothetical protein
VIRRFLLGMSRRARFGVVAVRIDGCRAPREPLLQDWQPIVLLRRREVADMSQWRGPVAAILRFLESTKASIGELLHVCLLSR